MSRTRLDFRRLTVAERIQLAQDLWDSVAESDEVIELTDAQRAELDRRIEAHGDDPSAAIPWEVFRKELLEG
jgi:putative addiction module component (TIGR02574 family)